MLTPRELLDKLKFRKKLRTDEEIKKAKENALEEAFIKQAKLKALITKEKTGWTEYVLMMEEFIERLQIQKLSYKIKDIMLLPHDECGKALKEMMLIDEDIEIVNRMIHAPKRFIDSVDRKAEKNAEAEVGSS